MELIRWVSETNYLPSKGKNQKKKKKKKKENETWSFNVKLNLSLTWIQLLRNSISSIIAHVQNA